jgi:Na+-transporting NADH:ubiquinone oxidoreductase subunit F
MTEIAIAVSIFSVLIIALTLVIAGARQVLAPQGSVTVVVNGRKSFTAPMGNTLLAALAAEKIYLPAACGGRGSCGQCKIKVDKGNEQLLPTETAHISRAAAASGMRLACMLRIHGDLEVQVPADLLDTQRLRCRVRSCRNITTYLREIVIDTEDKSFEFEAGDYVLVEAPPHHIEFGDLPIDPPYRDEWERFQLLSLVSRSDQAHVRAYSLANYPGEDQIIMLVVRIATPPHDAPAETPPGVVSSYLFSINPGDTLTVTGPFGEFHAAKTDREMVFIAGGAGIAPMRSILFDQLERLGSRRKISFWYGARNIRELCYEEDFDRLAREHDNFDWYAALSDPAPDSEWSGYEGFIHAIAYEHYLKNHPTPEEAEYYLCGPPLMTAGALHMLDGLGVDPDSIYLDKFGP